MSDADMLEQLLIQQAAGGWLKLNVIQCSADQKQRFSKGSFSDGLIFDCESYRTATSGLAFSYLRDISAIDLSLASRTGAEPVSPP